MITRVGSCWPILIILLLFAATAVAEVFIIDIGYGPDETAHFIYVRSLSDRMQLPEPTTELSLDLDSYATYQAHHPPLYYALAAVVYRLSANFGAETSAIYHILRLMTVLFGVGWIYCTWRLAREFFGRESLAPLLVAAFTAFLPLSTYMSAVVNNDVPEAMFFTWALWLTLAFLRRGSVTAKVSVWMGIVIGLAVLTKAQGLLLLPLLVLAAGMVLKGKPWRQWWTLAKGLAPAFGVVLLISGWWFIRSCFLFGQFLPQMLVRPVLNDLVDAFVLPGQTAVALRIATVNLFHYFWTPYWITRNFSFAGCFTALVLVLSLAGCVGLLVRYTHQGKTTRIHMEGRCVGFLIAAVGILWVSVIYQVFFVDWYVFQQGRLLLPVASALGVLMIVGLSRLVPKSIRSGAYWTALLAIPAVNWAYLVVVWLFYQLEK